MRILIFPSLLALLAPATAAEVVPVGEMIENRPSLADPTAKYTLYIPQKAAGDSPAPVLLVFDPRGRATMAAELFREAADRHGWILVSSNDTRSDGPWEPNQKAIDALWPEIHRYRIDERRIYATGFSGGAIVSWFLAQSTGEIAGIIAVGGRLPPEIPSKTISFSHFGVAGAWDFNYDEMKGLDELVAKRGRPHRLEIFQGPHTWFDPPLASEAVTWMELQAMREGRRPVDAAVVAEAWSHDVAVARELETDGKVLDAGRRWQAIERTFEGLREVSTAREAANRLARSEAFREALKAEERADARALRYDREILPRLGAAFAAGAVPSYEKLVRDLEIERLEATVERGGAEGIAAKRTLFELTTQTSFYIYRELVAAERWRDAETALRVAVRTAPQAPHIRYNLACAEALQGNVEAALESLDAAVALGFADSALLRTDPDLASLRAKPEAAARLDALVSRLER